MEDWMKYLVWIGWFLAVIGYWLGQGTAAWIALVEFIIGIVIGIFAFKKEFKGLFERAVFYMIAMTAIATMGAGIVPVVGQQIVDWIASYATMLALLYTPAAILDYVAKVFREGY